MTELVPLNALFEQKTKNFLSIKASGLPAVGGATHPDSQYPGGAS